MKYIIILLFVVPFTLFGESQIGVISALIYEYYQEPVDLNIDNVPISKPMISIMPQFIWKDDRSLLLLNIELLGALGSLEGSFGKNGVLSGQLKADSFYLGYVPNTDFYVKFGKYSSDTPMGFPVRTMTGQVESGIKSENIHIFSSFIFYNLFNKKEEDGSFTFKNERYNDENIYILNPGFNSKLLGLKIRLTSELDNNYSLVSFHPSISLHQDIFNFSSDSFAGLSIREYHNIWGLKEELTVNYYNFLSTLLLSYLSTNKNKNLGYGFTSIDNKDIDFHYGSHFNYLYQSCANLYGMTSIGFKQTFDKKNTNIWASYSGHFAIDEYESESRGGLYIGSIFSVGIKLMNLWAESTLLELYSSLFVPGGFSEINDSQEKDVGFQLVLKLQHIIF